ncbi:MAG: hypothetical protein ABI656_03325 [bacterium]
MIDLTSLSANELPLLYALAILDEPVVQTRLMELLHLLKQKTANGDAYDNKQLKNNLASLCKTVLIRQEIGQGYVRRDEVRMPLLLQLQQSGGLKQWIDSMWELLKRHQQYTPWKATDAAFCRREMLFPALKPGSAR